MYLAPLPAQVVRLLEALHAPPRLVAHLRLVHDVARTIISRIVAQTHQAQWHVFLTLDAIATGITAEADRRLAWQNQHPLS